MRALAFLLVLAACAGDDMAGRTRIPARGGALGAEERRNQGGGAGLNFGAYRPVDMALQPNPCTIPFGDGVVVQYDVVGANKVHFARIKGVLDDTAVALIRVRHGRPTVGTQTVGMALYEILEANDPATDYSIATTLQLRKIAGTERFVSVVAGTGGSTEYKPDFPLTLERSRAYSMGVVWSGGVVAVSRGIVLVQPEAQMSLDDATLTTGMPSIVPLSNRPGGTFTTQQVFSTEILPPRGATTTYNLY